MRFIKAVLLFTLLGICSFSNAQKFTSKSNGEVVIKGTSSIHDWESDVTQFTVTTELNLDEGTGTVQASFPVESIESGKSIMDGKTYDALESEAHPNITYTGSIVSISDGVITSSGTLTMAGASKKITLKAPYQIKGNTIVIDGSYDLKMTDYGITPPTAMMGALKTGDDITLAFNIILTK